MYDWILLGQIEYQDRLRRIQSRNRPVRPGQLVKISSKSDRRLGNAARTFVRKLRHTRTQNRTRPGTQTGEQAQPSIG
jgi:hypothetical protein